MKGLRIGLLLMFLVLTGAWLSATENVRLENPHQLTPKTAQTDTVRMTWESSSSAFMYFYFYGEESATYKVDWGDGKTATYTGEGAGTNVKCGHSYSNTGEYKVLLFGVASEESKK